MPRRTDLSVATMGIDIGKNSSHVVGLDQRGAIVVRQRWTRSQIRARLANVPPCLIGMEACVGWHGHGCLGACSCRHRPTCAARRTSPGHMAGILADRAEVGKSTPPSDLRTVPALQRSVEMLARPTPCWP